MSMNFDASTFGDDLEKEAIQSIREQLTGQVSGMKCPNHGQTPTVTVEGRDLDNLSIKVTACCEKFAAEVESQLSD